MVNLRKEKVTPPLLHGDAPLCRAGAVWRWYGPGNTHDT